MVTYTFDNRSIIIVLVIIKHNSEPSGRAKRKFAIRGALVETMTADIRSSQNEIVSIILHNSLTQFVRWQRRARGYFQRDTRRIVAYTINRRISSSISRIHVRSPTAGV